MYHENEPYDSEERNEQSQQQDGQYDGYGERYRQEPNGAGDPYRRDPVRPGKKGRGKVVLAVLLTVVFIGFCGVVSWLAVRSLEGRFPGLSEQPEAEILEQESATEDGTEPVETVPEDEKVQESILQEQTEEGAYVATDVTRVVENVMPACVSITNNFKQKVQDFWGQTYSRDAQGSGSGIIIGQNETELLIVSNNHVVDSADSLQVQFIDGEIVEAMIKGTDPDLDLAIVAVQLSDIPQATKDTIVVAKMGDSDHLKIGEPAIAIGNALGYGQSVTTGVISAKRAMSAEDGEEMIQTDAAINPGNSGGALLNIRGEVIGINSSKTYGSAIEGMGYAIPISTARPIIDELMERETRSRLEDEERGYLGISCITVTSDLSGYFDLPEGAFVAQVYSGTGADRAGLVRGDIITALEGVTVTSQEELNRQLSFYGAGETVEITIMQGSPTGYKAKNVEVTLSSYEEMNRGQKASEEKEEPVSQGAVRLP